MIVGFTGTRRGMTAQQKLLVRDGLRILEPEHVVHGDCIGADADFHAICQELNIDIHIRLSILPTRAYCSGAKKIHDAKPPIDRNHDIVDEADVMLATPDTEQEKLRSGTWATIRYARNRKPLRIYYPSGAILAQG